MRARIPAGLDYRREPLFGDPHEAVWLARRAHGVDRDLDVAIGPVLEPHGHRETGRELAMDLAFGRTRADRRPGDQVARVLRRDGIHELARGWDADLNEVQEKPARHPQAVVDPERAVAAGIRDEAFPAHAGARLHEVRTHHHDEVVAELVADHAEVACVVECREGIMYGARADDR